MLDKLDYDKLNLCPSLVELDSKHFSGVLETFPEAVTPRRGSQLTLAYTGTGTSRAASCIVVASNV